MEWVNLDNGSGGIPSWMTINTPTIDQLQGYEPDIFDGDPEVEEEDE